MAEAPVRGRIAALALLSIILTGCAQAPAREPARAPGSQPLIVAFGDSYTEGFGAPVEIAEPGRAFSV